MPQLLSEPDCWFKIMCLVPVHRLNYRGCRSREPVLNHHLIHTVVEDQCTNKCVIKDGGNHELELW